MQYKPEIIYLDIDLYDLNKTKADLYSKEELFTRKINGEYQNRYLLYGKDILEGMQLSDKLFNFIIEVYKYLYADGRKDILGYVKNEFCINLRAPYSYDLSIFYRDVQLIAYNIFKDDPRIFNTVDDTGFRIRRTKKNSDKNTILLVLQPITKVMNAFRKEQQVGEDLYSYATKQSFYHFYNAVGAFSKIPYFAYDYDQIYMPQEHNRRINERLPMVNGYLNFISDEKGEIGRRIADIAVYQNSRPTYISVKSFGPQIKDKAHLISLKLDREGIYDGKTYSAGVYLYHAVAKKYDEIANLYCQCDGDVQEILDFIRTNKNDAYITTPYLDAFLNIFNSMSNQEKNQQCIKFLECPLFKYWGINPFRFMQTFATYDRNVPITKNFTAEDVFSPFEEGIIEDRRNLISRDRIEKFINDAFGKGYLLFALKNRKIYIKDYRQFGLSYDDCKILEYMICYPSMSRNVVELRIMTKTFTIIGEIYQDHSLWPNKVSFFYFYNDFYKYFDYISDEENLIFDEGFLTNAGVKHLSNPMDPVY